MFTAFQTLRVPERRVPVIVVAALCLCAAWMTAAFATVNPGVQPHAFLGGMALAVVPALVYVCLALLIDRYETEPGWMLLAAFLWGAIAAVPLAGRFNPELSANYGTLLKGAFVEEVVKGAPLFLFFLKRDEFDDPIDGIVYATMVGLGFAMTENVNWYVGAWPDGVWDVVVQRGILSPFSHPLFTVMTGIGLGIAREKESRSLKVIAPVLGLGLAVILHSEWNLFTNPWVILPTFLFMVGAVALEQDRERNIIREHLEPYVKRGVFSAAEVDTLCRLGGRSAALLAAYRVAGLDGWRWEARFQQVASELAFHHWRVERGISRGPEADKAREDEYLRMLSEIRRHRAVPAQRD